MLFSSSELKILYRDEYLIAVDKPQGLLVHRSNIDKHEIRFLMQELRNQVGQHVYPIHRLDKPTSGLILFALNSTVVAQMQALMEANHASKEYLLVCRGHCEPRGVIDHPLKPISDFKAKNKKAKQTFRAEQDHKEAQEALTLYERLNMIEIDTSVDKYPTSRYSLVRAKIMTGRKHQIRRHFKHIAHPIIGCAKYGKSIHNRYFAEHLNVPRLLLHSYRMSFPHPVTRENIDIVAPLSGDFLSLLQLWGWEKVSTAE